MNTVPHSVAVAGRITAAGNPGKCNHLIYKLTCADYDRMMERSGGVCEMCGKPHARLSVDHDHDIGRFAVRGLLCPRCNAKMRRVDSGERPMDERAEHYVRNSFWRELSPRYDYGYPNMKTHLWFNLPMHLRVDASEVAAVNGTNVTAVLCRLLEQYIEDNRSLERYVKTK